MLTELDPRSFIVPSIVLRRSYSADARAGEQGYVDRKFLGSYNSGGIVLSRYKYLECDVSSLAERLSLAVDYYTEVVTRSSVLQ